MFNIKINFNKKEKETVQSIVDPSPDYWCPKCKDYAKRIIEIYDSVFESREWTGDCYELMDSDLDDCLVDTICYECYMERDEEVSVIDSDTVDK